MAVLENILVTTVVVLLASLFMWPQAHYARQTTLSQAALMGVGAYTAAFLVTRDHLPWSAAICASVLVTGVTGALLSAVTHRVREDIFTIATLGIQILLSNIFIVADPITGGATGIFFLPRLFNSSLDEALSLIAITCFALGVLWYLPRSRFGRHCRALGDDPILYETWGWSARRMKTLLGGAAGAGAAVAGAVLVAHLSVAQPNLFSIDFSIVLVAAVIFIPGRPLIVLPLASVIFAATPELLRYVGLDAARAAYGQRALFYGLLVVAAFRDRGVQRPLPGALSGGVWSQ